MNSRVKISKLTIHAAKTRGASHDKSGKPCQDAWCAKILKNGGVIAVSDGLGSAARSELGSEAAVSAAVSAVQKYFDKEYDDGMTGADIARDEDILFDAVESARKALEECAAENGCALRDVACTLCVILINGGTVSALQVGDGGIGAGFDTENSTEDNDGADSTEMKCGVLLEPVESEYINEVEPATSPDWKEHMKIVCGVTDVKCLAAFTDGCIRAVFVKKDGEYQTYDGFFKPVFEYFRTGGGMQTESGVYESEDILGLLKSQKLSEVSDDDKTLVIAVIETEKTDTENTCRTGTLPPCTEGDETGDWTE